MGISAGPLVPRDGMLLWYDFSTVKSFRGEPTTNLVPGTYPFSTYAYVTGPSDVTVLNESFLPISAKRYTVSNAVNVARAAIYPSLSINTSYTFSLKWRYNGTNTTAPQFALTVSKGNPEGGGGNTVSAESTTTTAIGNRWNYTVYRFSLSASPTGAAILTHGIVTGSDSTFVGNTFDIYEVQFEIKSNPTIFASGTRGTTVAAAGGVIDLSGSGNSGELLNGPTASYLSGGEVMFDGTNDYLDTGLDLSWNHTNSVTIMMSVKPTSLTSYFPFFGKGSDWEWQLMQKQTSLQFIYWNTGGGHTNGPIPEITNFFTTTGEFVHLAMVWSHSDNKYYFYRNGVLVNTTLWVDASINQNRATSVRIGGNHYVWGTNGAYWPGSVANVQVHGRALSAAEVLRGYNATRQRFVSRTTPVTSNLILHLDAANRDSYRGTGTTWTDLSGYGYNGTLNNGPVYRSSHGGGITFDGSNDSVTTGLTGSVVDLTVDCWFIGTNTGRNHLWDMGSYTGQAGDTNLNFNFNDSGYDLWIYWNGSGTNRLRYMVDGSFTDGRPKHMVFTHTGSTNKTYLNGVELTVTESGGTQTFNAVNSTPGNGFRLGGLVAFSGTIFSARVYSSALTAAEVLQNFNAGRRRFGL